MIVDFNDLFIVRVLRLHLIFHHIYFRSATRVHSTCSPSVRALRCVRSFARALCMRLAGMRVYSLHICCIIGREKENVEKKREHKLFKQENL